LDDFNRIAPDVELGSDVRLACFINAYGCSIGDRTKVGAYVEIQKGAAIGSDCKISSHTFVCEGVKIANECFIGHSVTFINDKYPRSTNVDGSLQTEDDWSVEPTEIMKRASIGSGSTILSGVSIGEGAIVGAGSVLTKNVPAFEIWAGNPARFIRKVDPK
jgi:acetyltransferase-like isoleucine patch superfamily enzyme